MNALWIAWRELVAMLGTATGWLVLAGFLWLTGFFWIGFVNNYVSLAADVVFNPYGAAGLTLKDHLLVPFFVNTVIVMLMVTPAISMRLFSSELAERTLELLLTSPVTTAEIVLGKYLGALAYLLLMLACTLYYPLMLFQWAAPDPGLLVGGYLSLVLVGAALLAAGTLFSSMTSSQMLAAVLAFAFGLILYVASWLGEGPDSWLTHVTIPAHVEEMVQGQLRLSDLVYFAGIIGFFLLFTHQQIETRRWT